MRGQQAGPTRDRPRPGQPRVTTPAQDRHIRLTHLCHPFQPASQTASETPGSHRNEISSRTDRRRRMVDGSRAYRVNVGMVLDSCMVHIYAILTERCKIGGRVCCVLNCGLI